MWTLLHITGSERILSIVQCDQGIRSLSEVLTCGPRPLSDEVRYGPRPCPRLVDAKSANDMKGAIKGMEGARRGITRQHCVRFHTETFVSVQYKVL